MLTGLYYYEQRYYDANKSTFLGVAPLAERTPNWTPYRYGYNNPLKFIDPDGKTEVERNKAVAQARKWIGSKYGFHEKPVLGKTTIDCSGLVRYAMMKNENISDPMKLWNTGDRGVDVIVKASREIDDVNNIEIGNVVVWKSGGREQGHVAMISEVTRKDDKVVSYKVIHAEGYWESKKLGISGGGNVNETEIFVGGKKGYSRSKYNHKFYEWDTPESAIGNETYGPYKINEVKIKGKGNTKLKSITDIKL